MNLKRHHVLYGLLALSLMLALVVFLIPRTSSMSYTSSSIASPDSVSKVNALQSTKTQAMRFEIVKTAEAQERGLGGRSDVPQNYAMLFVFPSDQNIGFWMKDMLVPIDMIWVSDTGTILGIEDSVAPDTYPQIFYPPQPVKYVLETRAGEAQRRGWSVGTHVDLPLP